MFFGQSDRGHAAHGEPDEMAPLDLEGIEQRHRIADQQIEGVSPLRRVGPAMAAVVVAQDVEVVAQQLGLLIPHGKIGGERIGEHQPGCAIASVDPAMEGDSVGFDFHGCVFRSDRVLPEILEQREEGFG